MSKRVAQLVAVIFALACMMAAQSGPGPAPDKGPGMGHMHCPMMDGPGTGSMMGGPGMGSMMGHHTEAGMGPMGPFGHAGMGKWWKNPELVKKLGLTDAQVQQLNKIAQDHRMQEIDLRATLEKQEAALEPLMESDKPDEAQVMAQLDKVGQARTNLQKSNTQSMLAIRRVLTPEQWKQLHSQPHEMHHMRQGPPPAGKPAGKAGV